MELSVYAVPALIALTVKVWIYLYVRPNALRNVQTRLFLLFLITLSVHNLSELSYFITPSADGTTGPGAGGGYTYYSASIMALAFLMHLVLLLAHDWPRAQRRWLWLVYAPGIPLQVMLWTGDLVVAGFQPVNYTYQHVSGPLYFLVEAYVLGYVWAIVAALIYGAIYQSTGAKRRKNRWMLLGLIPMGVLVTLAVLMERLGITAFNTTFTLPFPITFFLLVSAYATHQHRLFDIAFFLPGSPVRRRKTAFYDRIRALIAELADLPSVNQAINRLADTLQCPVVLLGSNRPVVAAVGGAQNMALIPTSALHRYDHIVVASEIADTDAATYTAMKNHGVGAIVPFHPYARSASGWLLLGGSFSDRVYSSLDFRMVETLFDKMGELFLDKLLSMRSQLATTTQRVHTLEGEIEDLESRLTNLTADNARLRADKDRLLKEQPADSLVALAGAQEASVNVTVTVLTRDRRLRKALRELIPQAQYFVGADSAGFRRQSPPDVLVCDASGASQDAGRSRLVDRAILSQPQHTAVLLLGEYAAATVAEQRGLLVGRLIEVAPPGAAPEALARKIRALAALGRATYGAGNPENPLVGVSPAFAAAMEHLRRFAAFRDTVWLEAADLDQSRSAAAYLHGASGQSGDLLEVDARGDGLGLEDILPGGADDTVLVLHIDALPLADQQRLLDRIEAGGAPRLVLASTLSPEHAVAQSHCITGLAQRARPFAIRLPTLAQRAEDLRLLIHYFTLQFNLQADTLHYLSQAEVEALESAGPPESVAELRRFVFESLRTKLPATSHAEPAPEADLSEKPLDELVGEFEARIIEQALKRCDGNKSKAARMLGLRPNTLHYKLERYGLAGKARRK
jgi:hypothetical protein